MSELAEELFHGVDTIVAAKIATVGAARVAEGDTDLWDLLDRQGFARLDAADPDLGLAEHLAVARAIGRNAVGLPVVEAGIASWMAAATGLKLPEGLAVPALGPDATLLAERRPDGSLEVSGRLARIAWGRLADHVVVFVTTPEQESGVALVTPTAIVHGSNLAGEPRDDVLLDRIVLEEHALAPAASLTLLEVRARSAALRAAQAAGAMERVLDLVVEYAGQREQFGTPIGQFQAVQQHLVTVAGGAAATRAAVEAVVQSDPAYRMVAAASAKVTAGIRSGTLARSAHQVFGAIGVTQEHRLHLLTRRLWSWQDECGSAAEWSRYLADRLVFADGPGAWAVVTPPNAALDARHIGAEVAW